MTVNELNKYRWLVIEVEKKELQLAELEELAASPSSPNFSGMPSAHNGASAVENFAVKIADLKMVIYERYAESLAEKLRLEMYINTIDDPITRLVFEYKFVDGLNWEQVADELGGSNTSDAVKMRVYRYLKK